MNRPLKSLFAPLALSAALVLSACGSDETAATPTDTAPVEVQEPATITVFAAASLKATFTEIAEEFSAENPGWEVEFNFAGSSDLVTQITEGAPADVFASADEKNMAKLDPAALADPAELFATNTMIIAVPPGNPAGIESLEDLTSPDVKVVLCAPQVPCGSAAAAVETNAGIDITPVSEEAAVTDVLGKVSSGEADAGIVYVTDVQGAGDAVESVEIDEDVNAVNKYPIAALTASDDAEVAEAFVAFVLSKVGLLVLADAGFGAP